MKLDDWLAQRSQSCPERTALVADGTAVTYAELEAEATWVARRLAAHGVRRGSTAALTMHPRREQVVLLHALLKLGATVLPLSPQMTPAEHAAIIAAEEADVDLVEPGELTQTEADLPLLGEHDMDDIACRVLTSGSSGTAHPVGLTYGNFLWSAVGSSAAITAARSSAARRGLSGSSTAPTFINAWTRTTCSRRGSIVSAASEPRRTPCASRRRATQVASASSSA